MSQSKISKPQKLRRGLSRSFALFSKLKWLLCLGFIMQMAGRGLAQIESATVTLDYVTKQAWQRANQPFHSPRADLPQELLPQNLNDDQYRQIEFRDEKALWAMEGLPFRVEFFHPGGPYADPVQMHEFSANYTQPIRFVQDFFRYNSVHLPNQIPVATGYAGFRLLNRLNEPDRWDELGAFLAGSDFRLLGKGQRYGAFARGLALDCGEPGRTEETPLFTDWWLGKPQPGDMEVRLYALLDSVSCAGAYEFLIKPGETTVADVEAVLFFRKPETVNATDPQRKPIQFVGLAPMASMFFIGKNSERKFDDYRPEVHDSDGLLMEMQNGQMIWRPLDNPANGRYQDFAAKNVRGFGLLQRERDFADYQDTFNYREKAPGIWAEPHGDWGDGNVHLLEMPAQNETQPNIVAFWSPKNPPQPLQAYRFAYTLFWTRERDMKLSRNKVVATREGADPHDPGDRQFVVDFKGPRLAAIPQTSPPQADVACTTNAVIARASVFPLRNTGLWRVVLTLQPKPSNKIPVDLRCTLKVDQAPVAETWDYLWSPPADNK